MLDADNSAWSTGKYTPSKASKRYAGARIAMKSTLSQVSRDTLGPDELCLTAGIHRTTCLAQTTVPGWLHAPVPLRLSRGLGMPLPDATRKRRQPFR